MIHRRSLLIALGACPLAAPLRPFAQTAKPARIGYLASGTEASARSSLEVFKQAFRDLGRVEGRDYVLETRFADSRLDDLPNLAAELVRLRMDVILAESTTPARALQKATSTIPIVLATSGDPVGSGLARSLGRPGGNVTGNSLLLTDIAPKHLELLRDAIPNLTRLAVLMNPAYQSHRDALKILQTSALRIGVQILPIEARSPEQIAPGFLLLAVQKAEAIIVLIDPIFGVRQQEIADLALKGRLPIVAQNPNSADAGFLIAYGPSMAEFFRRTAYYVDKILKGAKPAELPIEQPSTFELVINLRTAKALGLKVPQSILLRADRVIE